MQTRLLSTEQILQGPFPASIFLKSGLMGFGSMKKGQFYLTNKRLILEGDGSSIAGTSFTNQDKQAEGMETALKISLSKDVIIPLDALTEVKRGKFMISKKVITVFGEGIETEGWRIVFQSGFLKVVQQLIDMNKWNDEIPAALKVSRHLA